MRAPHYNIARLLGAISFVAVGCAALREANDLWDSTVFSLTLGLLLGAVVLSVYRSEARRAFWLGFALFGWGYLSFSLISPTESRLITTHVLAYLERANIFGHRGNVVRVIPDLDRMRVHNVSLYDLIKSTEESRFLGSPEQERLREKSGQRLEFVLGWDVLNSTVHSRYNNPELYGNIVIKASPEGDVLRLKDVATVGLGASFFIPGGGMGTPENFVRIGHSLFAVIVGWLGGVLARKLRPSD